MTEPKRCFLSAERPCDLTCKAAFEVDDPVDNVDCHFIWLAYHLGEGAIQLGQTMLSMPGGPGKPGPGGGPAPGKTPPGGPSSN